eukprot:1606022-Pyramimonas_sp.AAC.1
MASFSPVPVSRVAHRLAQQPRILSLSLGYEHQTAVALQLPASSYAPRDAWPLHFPSQLAPDFCPRFNSRRRATPRGMLGRCALALQRLIFSPCAPIFTAAARLFHRGALDYVRPQLAFPFAELARGPSALP